VRSELPRVRLVSVCRLRIGYICSSTTASLGVVGRPAQPSSPLGGFDAPGRLCLPDGLDTDRMHRFVELCLDELRLADASCIMLEDAVISTRHRTASLIGCEPSWDQVLAHASEVTELTRPWRERLKS